MTDLEYRPNPLLPAISVVGPVEPWSPSQEVPGPAQDPGGRSGSPAPLRPPGTTVPCDRCEGGSRPPGGDEVCRVCAGRDEVDLVWRVSGYDEQAHAFVVSADESADLISAPRPCWHSVPKSKVTDDVDCVRKCPACLITVAAGVTEHVVTSAAARLADLQAGLADLPDGRELFGPIPR